MLQCRRTLLGVCFIFLNSLPLFNHVFSICGSVLLILIIIICFPLYQAAANGLPYFESQKNAISL